MIHRLIGCWDPTVLERDTVTLESQLGKNVHFQALKPFQLWPWRLTSASLLQYGH